MSEGGQQVSETVVGGLWCRVVHVRKADGLCQREAGLRFDGKG